MSAVIPTRETAVKVLDVLSHGLCHGVGEPIPGKMCVEAAVCFALGLPHSDNPPCVAPAVRLFKIALNDSQWSSNEARAKGLRRMALAQLGSDSIDQTLFVKELALATVRQIVPLALRAAAEIPGNASHQANLLDHATKCEAVKELSAASAASYAASYAASDAARAASYAASYAASDAASDAASAASYAARAASYAASDAARAASDAASDAASAARAASYAASDAASDQALSLMAEAGVQALIVCKSPGCEWLDLTEA